MNRRFRVPSMCTSSPQPRRVQNLPDDFASFIPSGLVRRDTPRVAQGALPAPLLPPAPQSLEATLELASIDELGDAIFTIEPVVSTEPSTPSSVEPPHQLATLTLPIQLPAKFLPREAIPEFCPVDSLANAFSNALNRAKAVAEQEIEVEIKQEGSEPTKQFFFVDSPFLDPNFQSLSESPNTRPDDSKIPSSVKSSSARSRRASRRAPRTGTKNARPAQTTLQRHRRKCAICNHPERDMIEFYFIGWTSSYRIAVDFGLTNTSIVYRHARALGLFAKRSRNLRGMLEVMFEQVAKVTPTADSLVRAVRTYASLTRNGEWVEPVTTHLVTTVPAAASSSRSTPANSASAESASRSARINTRVNDVGHRGPASPATPTPRQILGKSRKSNRHNQQLRGAVNS